jgi:hypothetical protein
LTTSRDDWHDWAIPGDHPLALMFRDPAVGTIEIQDRYGEGTRRYRRGGGLDAL